MRFPHALLTLAALAAAIHAQPAPAPAPAPVPPVVPIGQDAESTREQFMNLMNRYPPTLRTVLALDPSLLSNDAYLAPYAGLSAFLKAHPEIQHNIGFFLPAPFQRERGNDFQMTEDILGGLAGFAGAGMAIGLLVWLVKSFRDNRRWNKIAGIQTEFHSKILDRFSSNADLLAYVQSPAGARFFEFSPITVEAAKPSMGAPMNRILWSVQVGLILLAAGIGLEVASRQVAAEASAPLHVLGVLAIALGCGFAVSSAASYFISARLGLLQTPPRSENPV